MRFHRYAVLSLATLALAGCTDKTCQPADSAKTCEVLTQCFQRGEKAPACRQIEADQREYERTSRRTLPPPTPELVRP